MRTAVPAASRCIAEVPPSRTVQSVSTKVMNLMKLMNLAKVAKVAKVANITPELEP